MANNFVNPYQFYGVDNNTENISFNQDAHPEANWIYGDWNEVIQSHNFNPAMVSLDTNCTISRISIDMTSRTMLKCPPKTVLFVNVMKNNPRSTEEFNHDAFICGIQNRIPPSQRRLWNDYGTHFEYNATGKTRMATFCFYRR